MFLFDSFFEYINIRNPIVVLLTRKLEHWIVIQQFPYKISDVTDVIFATINVS